MIPPILHIGVQRTGTTFLQKEIFPKLDVIYYNQPSFKYLIDNAYKFTGKPTLISQENLWADMWVPSDVYARLRFLQLYFPYAKILFGVRKESSLFYSWYKKYIINGGTLDIDGFYANYLSDFPDMPEYIKQLKEYYPDVLVYNYEDLKQHKEDTLFKICQFIYNNNVPEYKDIKHNAGYTNNQIWISRIINTLFKTKLNPTGIIPLHYNYHPHRVIFQRGKK